MSEVAKELFPFIRIYKDGSAERLMGNETVFPSLDTKTNVESKDVVYSHDLNLSSRLYLPKNINPNQKLSLLLYFHGGGFCIQSPFSPLYHNHLNALVVKANVIAISVGYRLAPENPLPLGYDDSWTALKWVASHVNGNGPEEWLNTHADFGKVFLAGDSSGANMAHHLAVRYGQENLVGIELVGIVLVHPFFWGKERIGKETEELDKEAKTDGEFHLTTDVLDGLWHLACPTSSGCDDPLINPITDPKFPSLGCSRVLILVAEKDLLRDRAWLYYEKLDDSEWEGKVEIVETKQENHIFHLINPTCENAEAMLEEIAVFLNHQQA